MFFEEDDQISEICREGVRDAAIKILLRKQHVSAESILFDVWSDTIEKIYKIFNYQDYIGEWIAASKEEKISAFRGKILNFEDFEENALNQLPISTCETS
ncbi:MAG TPA: hypothetical protein PLF30_03560 [Candidatus Moranbacteria bacterium]|jgi:hypothetical protein|nr:hypothetical protein [Candidatus Moranbacteria bacterium]HOF42495.1 hypothetical protein [Candidatus Moranbacteria bacterium]HPX94603.1 hypothetical protein [Candidatus Moranbacteria bacterium]HQB59806.1 hypothetical protein [Candidatus Moranbacteria bacterium]